MSDPNQRPSIAAIREALIANFRAHGGKVTEGPFVGRDILLLTATGAKSGLARLAPLVTVKVGPETFQALAEVADEAERDRLYAQHAAPNPGFHDYQARTTRRIPVVLLERLGRPRPTGFRAFARVPAARRVSAILGR